MTELFDFFDAPVVLLLLFLAPVFPLMGRRSITGLGAVRARLAVAARIGVFTLLVLALAGAHRVRRTDALSAIFLLDRSQSVPQDQQKEADELVRDAVRLKRPAEDRVGVISFARDRQIDQPPSAELRSTGREAMLRRDRTDLASALRLAAALAPPDTNNRVVVLSDGNENTGQALGEAAHLSASKVPVDVAPLRYRRQRDVAIERLECPQTATRNEPVALDVILRASHATKGRIQLRHNGNLVSFAGEGGAVQSGIPVTLEPGVTSLRINRPLRESGFHRFTAQFVPDDPSADAAPENDEAQAFTIVGGRDRVLILCQPDVGELTGDERAAQVIAEALAAQSIETDLRISPGFQLDPPALMGYSVVILSNLPAGNLTPDEQKALASYVQEQGGGLIAVGGDSSFCMGGYGGTPLEAILPVETDRTKLNLLSLALVLIIDRSGSMSGEKMELARQAAAASVQLLSSRDKVGVIAFDFVSHWVVRLAPCVAKQRVIHTISRIEAGGGTNLLPAMEEAFLALKGNRSDTQHVVILSDGQSVPGDFLRVAREMAKHGITISTIGVGGGADRALLSSIAQATSGRFYFTDSPKAVPRLFARETVLANRSGIVEESFTPQFGGGPLGDPFLAGIGPSDLPPLHGYVIALPKGSADVSLYHPREGHEDPILARWRAGLGKSVALTSGLWGQWGRDWAAWPGFSKFWAQLVRWTARAPQSDDLNISTSVDGARVTVRVEATTESLAGRSSLSVAAGVVGPDFVSRPVRFAQVGAGISEATFDAEDAGSYVLSVAYRYGNADGSSRQGVAQAGFTINVSPELREVQSNEWLLQELARRTQGRELSPADAARVYRPDPMPVLLTRRPIWSLLLKMACFLFLLDVAIRRVALDPLAALARTRLWLAHAARWRAPQSSATTVESLKFVRGKVRERNLTAAPDRPGAAAPVAGDSAASPDSSAARPEVDAASPGYVGTPTPAEMKREPTTAQRKEDKQVDEDDASPTARLLRAKRRAIRNRGDPPA